MVDPMAVFWYLAPGFGQGPPEPGSVAKLKNLLRIDIIWFFEATKVLFSELLTVIIAKMGAAVNLVCSDDSPVVRLIQRFRSSLI